MIDMFCTVSIEVENLLTKLNILYRKLELTIERPDENGNLVFLDMNINGKNYKKLIASGTRNQLIRELSRFSVAAVCQSNIGKIS